MIQPDDTTVAFIRMLRDVLADEPPIPDPDLLGAHGVAEAELNHYEWRRHGNALRLLIGVRLTNLALEDEP